MSLLFFTVSDWIQVSCLASWDWGAVRRQMYRDCFKGIAAAITAFATKKNKKQGRGKRLKLFSNKQQQSSWHSLSTFTPWRAPPLLISSSCWARVWLPTNAHEQVPPCTDAVEQTRGRAQRWISSPLVDRAVQYSIFKFRSSTLTFSDTYGQGSVHVKGSQQQRQKLGQHHRSDSTCSKPTSLKVAILQCLVPAWQPHWSAFVLPLVWTDAVCRIKLKQSAKEEKPHILFSWDHVHNFRKTEWLDNVRKS